MHPPRRLQGFAFSFAALLFSSVSPLIAQSAATPAIPEGLKPAFALLQSNYPKVEAKRAPKAPADSVWIFRSTRLGEGTIEVGFQANEVVYMIFRRGTGGAGWKLPEIKAIHLHYHKDLLHEEYDPVRDVFSRYNHAVTPQINAAVITRKDFNVKALFSGI